MMFKSSLYINGLTVFNFFTLFNNSLSLTYLFNIYLGTIEYKTLLLAITSLLISLL